MIVVDILFLLLFIVFAFKDAFNGIKSSYKQGGIKNVISDTVLLVVVWGGIIIGIAAFLWVLKIIIFF